MAEPTRNRWRGVAADVRAAERRAALVDVAFELLGSEGMTGTTVRRVCEVARLNPRYFYESFEDLDALLVAVFDRTALDMVGAMASGVAGAATGAEATPEAVTRAGIASVMRHVAEDPRRARVLFMEGLNNEALGRRRFTTLHELAESMVRDAQQQGGLGEGPLPPIVLVGANFLVGGMAELVMSWVVGRLEITLDELIDSSVALFLAVGRSIDDIVAGDGAAPGPGDDGTG